MAATGGEADGACATAPTVPGRQSVISFCYVKHKFFMFHSTILHTNRGQFLALMAPEGRILKANFKNLTNMTSQHMHCFGCRQYKKWHIVKPLSRQQFFCDVCKQLRSKKIYSRHISTSRAQWHRTNNKISTAVSMFWGQNFNVANSGRPIVWRRLDICQISKMAERRHRSALADIFFFVMSCHVMAVSLDLIETGIAPFDSQTQKTLP